MGKVGKSCYESHLKQFSRSFPSLSILMCIAAVRPSSTFMQLVEAWLSNHGPQTPGMGRLFQSNCCQKSKAIDILYHGYPNSRCDFLPKKTQVQKTMVKPLVLGPSSSAFSAPPACM